MFLYTSKYTYIKESMKLLITCPSVKVPHGGIRIILEWANRLTLWHDVTLFVSDGYLKTEWFTIDSRVKCVANLNTLKEQEIVIIASPHDINIENMIQPNQKCFIFMQMAEHIFNDRSIDWLSKCEKFYRSKYPLISISQWNIDMLKNKYQRAGETHYIGNGVNLIDFPISNKPKDGKIVLVEGWEAGNSSKDNLHIGPKVAARLKARGFKIIAFSGLPLSTMPEAVSEYYYKADTETMNRLYESATILIKATNFDARACAPMEAMTKGTVTARAVNLGDDDLINEENSLKSLYDEESLFNNCLRLLTDTTLREKLSKNCIEHVQKYDWDYWLQKINNIITMEPKIPEETKQIKKRVCLIALKYYEPSWANTKKCIDESGLDVIYVDRDGIGSMSKAFNSAIPLLTEKYNTNLPDYLFFVTNIEFDISLLTRLVSKMDETGFAGIHPAHGSDHQSHHNDGSGLVKETKFIEWTAPIIKTDLFIKQPLDSDHRYAFFDLIWSYEIKKFGYKVGVDHGAKIGHTYLVKQKSHPLSELRYQLRAYWEPYERIIMTEKYGPNWVTMLF